MKQRKIIILLAFCAFFLGVGSISIPEMVSATQIHLGIGVVVAPHHYHHRHRRHQRGLFIAPRVVVHNDHRDRDDHHDNGEHRGNDRH